MATSGTATFNLDINEIIEEAYERAGLGRAFSGNDYRTARRSLNLLGQDFANRGINLWTIEDTTLSLTSGTASYTLPADTVSILDHSIRTGTGTSQSDLTITRMSLGEYAGISSKNTQGRPVKIYIERLRDAPQITVWPVPDNNTYTLVYYRIRRIEDSAAGANNQYDAPTRFLPAIISGLAYQLALKNPSVTDRITLLKQVYEEDFNLAATEDRDRSDFRIVPAL
jgi:hypothetical protein